MKLILTLLVAASAIVCHSNAQTGGGAVEVADPVAETAVAADPVEPVEPAVEAVEPGTGAEAVEASNGVRIGGSKSEKRPGEKIKGEKISKKFDPIKLKFVINQYEDGKIVVESEDKNFNVELDPFEGVLKQASGGEESILGGEGQEGAEIESKTDAGFITKTKTYVSKPTKLQKKGLRKYKGDDKSTRSQATSYNGAKTTSGALYAVPTHIYNAQFASQASKAHHGGRYASGVTSLSSESGESVTYSKPVGKSTWIPIVPSPYSLSDDRPVYVDPPVYVPRRPVVYSRPVSYKPRRPSYKPRRPSYKAPKRTSYRAPVVQHETKVETVSVDVDAGNNNGDLNKAEVEAAAEAEVAVEAEAAEAGAEAEAAEGEGSSSSSESEEAPKPTVVEVESESREVFRRPLKPKTHVHRVKQPLLVNVYKIKKPSTYEVSYKPSTYDVSYQQPASQDYAGVRQTVQEAIDNSASSEVLSVPTLHLDTDVRSAVEPLQIAQPVHQHISEHVHVSGNDYRPRPQGYVGGSQVETTIEVSDHPPAGFEHVSNVQNYGHQAPRYLAVYSEPQQTYGSHQGGYQQLQQQQQSYGHQQGSYVAFQSPGFEQLAYGGGSRPHYEQQVEYARPSYHQATEHATYGNVGSHQQEYVLAPSVNAPCDHPEHHGSQSHGTRANYWPPHPEIRAQSWRG